MIDTGLSSKFIVEGDIIQVGGTVVLTEGTERLSCDPTACRVAMGGGHLPPIGGSGALPWEKLNWGGGAEKCIQCILSEQRKHFSLPTL